SSDSPKNSRNANPPGHRRRRLKGRHRERGTYGPAGGYDVNRFVSLLATALVVASPMLGRAGTGEAAAPRVTFVEVTPQTSKITWAHDNAMSPDRYLPETCGAGGAFFDYDGDGWQDLFFVNSGASDFFTPTKPIKNGLWRNNHDGTFTDVTDAAGVAGGKFFGMGASAGDFDGDGDQDLFVTAY